MDCAANHGHAKLIQLLIDCNAPIDAKDRSQVCVLNACWKSFAATDQTMKTVKVLHSQTRNNTEAINLKPTSCQ